MVARSRLTQEERDKLRRRYFTGQNREKYESLETLLDALTGDGIPFPEIRNALSHVTERTIYRYIGTLEEILPEIDKRLIVDDRNRYAIDDL